MLLSAAETVSGAQAQPCWCASVNTSENFPDFIHIFSRFFFFSSMTDLQTLNQYSPILLFHLKLFLVPGKWESSCSRIPQFLDSEK